MKAGEGAGISDSAAVNGMQKATESIKSAVTALLNYTKTHSGVLIPVLCLALLLLMISGMVSSCSMMMNGMGNTLLGTSYTAEDEDILGADADYKALETALRRKIDNIESTNPSYDE